ncbi:hypothetical protein ACFLU6_15785 [Acidobacteriota bacterium]
MPKRQPTSRISSCPGLFDKTEFVPTHTSMAIDSIAKNLSPVTSGSFAFTRPRRIGPLLVILNLLGVLVIGFFLVHRAHISSLSSGVLPQTLSSIDDCTYLGKHKIYQDAFYGKSSVGWDKLSFVEKAGQVALLRQFLEETEQVKQGQIIDRQGRVLARWDTEKFEIADTLSTGGL